MVNQLSSLIAMGRKWQLLAALPVYKSEVHPDRWLNRTTALWIIFYQADNSTCTVTSEFVLWVYVWWDWYLILPIHLLHTNWTIVAPLFYSLRFSVSLPAYINLQRSCRKASCSSSRESHIIFKAVMMNIQTICLPSGSYCSLFVITQMGISSVAIEIQFGVVLCSLS